MSLFALPVSVSDLETLQQGIEFHTNTPEATTEAALITAGTATVASYAQQLINNNISLSQVAMADDSLMFGATDTVAELTKLSTQFLPAQVTHAIAAGFNPTVYAAEALGLALAGGNGTSTAFATNFGSLSVSDFASAVAIVTGVNPNGIQQFVTNWINFYTANPAATFGLSVTLASYGAAFGDAVGVALLNQTAANLPPLVANALIDNAEGTYVVGVALALQVPHTPLQGETITPPTINLTTGVDNVIVQLNGTVVNGIANGTGATFNPQDSINGNGHTGLTFNLNDLSIGGIWAPTNVPSVTISGVQAANLNSSEAVSANTATSPQGWTGLTQLNVNESSSGKASTITAAGTTNVAVTDGALAGTTDAVQGGANVTVTAIDTAADSAITVGSVTAPTGNVTIKETTDGAGDGAGPINVTGSATTTTVSVTQILAAATDTAGLININDVNAFSTTKAGSITTVVIDGLGGAAPSSAFITSNALTSLTVNNNQAFNSAVFINDRLTPPTATTLALSLNNNVQAVRIVDSPVNEYKTINVLTGAEASTAFIFDSGATALTVAGSSVLTLSGSELSNVASIAIGGAAGLIDTDYAGSTTLASVTDTSSGPVTLSLNDQVASFSGAGGTGAEIITITADATKAITGNGAGNSEIIFNAAASTFTAGNTGANVTGFSVLGVGTSGSGTFAMNASPFSAFTSIDDLGAAATFTKITAGTALAIDAATGGAVIYQVADSSGASDSVDITLGLTAARAALLGLGATAGGFTVASTLTLEDNTNGGIGTVSFTINNTTAGSSETISTLDDAALASLTIAGTGDLTVTDTFTDTATSLKITDNSTSTAGLHFAGGITDNNLTSLTLAGSNTAAMVLTSLTDTGTSLTVTDSYAGSVSCVTLTAVNATTESFTNTGGGALTVGTTANTGAALASLTLSGNVAYTATADAVSTGITVNGGSDNANVNFSTTHALAAGKTDSFTLGNGNNIIVDATTAGTLNITLGTGQNSVTTGTGTANVAVGAHSAPDAFIVGANASETILTSITGAQAVGVRDTITIADATTFNATAITSAQVTAAGGDPTTLDGWVKGALSAAGHNAAQHEADWFVFNGNTYIVEQSAAAGTAFGAGDTLVQLVGLPTPLSNGTIADHTITL